MPNNPILSENKSDALDFIFENVLKSGFGTLNKTELESILFAAIMNYSAQANLTDYKLGMYLQITQQRVRNLKERVSVKYCIINDEEAIDIFIEKLSNARVDGVYIDIPIYDIALKNYLVDLLEKENILLHSQLNPKIFRIRLDDLFDLMMVIESVRNEAGNLSITEIRENISFNLSNSNNNLRDILGTINSISSVEEFKKESLKSTAFKVLQVISMITSSYPTISLMVNKLSAL